MFPIVICGFIISLLSVPLNDKILPESEFAARIKAKYPAYADVEEKKLVRAILEKYPAYKTKVDTSDFVEPEPIEQETIDTGGLTGRVAEELRGIGGTIERGTRRLREQAAQVPGVIRDVGAAIEEETRPAREKFAQKPESVTPTEAPVITPVATAVDIGEPQPSESLGRYAPARVLKPDAPVAEPGRGAGHVERVCEAVVARDGVSLMEIRELGIRELGGGDGLE